MCTDEEINLLKSIHSIIDRTCETMHTQDFSDCDLDIVDSVGSPGSSISELSDIGDIARNILFENEETNISGNFILLLFLTLHFYLLWPTFY